MIFTNEDGEKFELDGDSRLSEPSRYVRYIIRPVKAEPKRYSINLFVLDEEPVDTEPPERIAELHYEADTKDQAQLIKEVVEALMESIMGRNVKDDPFEDYELRDRINKARAALKDEL